MSCPDLATREHLDRALRGVGLSWQHLVAHAGELVLFGSRACGCASARSDWDLLCIGDGTSRRTRSIDILWLSSDFVRSHAWKASELAGHIAAYGRWLHGQPSWQAELRSDMTEASQAKTARIARRMHALERAWNQLSAPYRQKHWVRLRRDLQRHALIMEGQAVPPSAWLDAAWSRTAEPREDGARLYRNTGLHSAFLDVLLDELYPVQARSPGWLEEARRRDAELDADPSRGRPAEDAFRDARARLG